LIYSCRPKISIAMMTTGGLATSGPREAAGHLAVGDLDLRFADIEPVGAGCDDLGAHGAGGQHVASGDAAEEAVKPRRENGATLVRPMTSSITTGRQLDIVPKVRNNVGVPTLRREP
jgi:hypothetical protein